MPPLTFCPAFSSRAASAFLGSTSRRTLNEFFAVSLSLGLKRGRWTGYCSSSSSSYIKAGAKAKRDDAVSRILEPMIKLWSLNK
jgi:hypothetical protein